MRLYRTTIAALGLSAGLASANIDEVIGVLPAGKCIIIEHAVTVNASPAGSQISSQGTVSGSNFSTVSTDDPDQGGGADPTVTPLLVGGPVGEITVIDDATSTTLTDGQAGVIDFGCTMPGNPVPRTFTVRNDGSADLILPSDGLTLPTGFSQNPGWPTALITPEFKVVVKKQNGAASAVDFTSFELVTMPDILSITAITLRIPDQWIELNNQGTAPDSQSPFFDGDTPFVIDPATTGLDIDEVNGVGTGWFCDPPGAQNNPNGDICVEFGGLAWNQGQQNRYSEATLRFTQGAFSGSLDDPSQNDDVTFGFGVQGLNNPRVPGANNDGEAFWEAGVEVDVILFNSVTNSSETVSGLFVDDGNPTNGISEAVLQATPVLVPIPVTIPAGQTWNAVIGSPFTVQLDASVEGQFSGDWSLESNDADENPFNFPIAGIVDGTPPDIVNLPSNIVQPAAGVSCEAQVSWIPPSVVDVLDPNPTIVQTMGPPPGSIFQVGVHTIEYTATDCAGNVRVGSFTVSVTDQQAPSLVGTLPKRIIANAAPNETSVIVNFGPFSAIDNCDPNPEVICSRESGTSFNLGATQVCCFARDSSGNESPQQCFDVIVIQAQPIGGLRNAEVVFERNLPAPGVAGASLFNANHAFLNEAGSVVMEVQMLNAGSNNVALFKDIGGGLQLVSRKGDVVPGIGLSINRYDDIGLSELGDVGFEGFLGGATSVTDAFHGSDVSGSVQSGVREGDTAPTSSAIFESLRDPAFDGQGNMISPAYLAIGPGGVTVSSNTGIWRKPAVGPLEQVALEGASVGSAIPGAFFGQVESRVVANASGEIAFYAFLDVDGMVVTLNDNTVILSGLPGNLSVVSREGEVAPDSDGALFEKYAAESINNGGQVAFEAGLKTGSGSPVTSSNNTGVYTNSNGPVELVAREGDLAPCLGASDVFFSSFRDIFIADNGDVYFHVFLTGPGVGSDTDGSFWRWRASDATLHPVMREGDVAPSTQGAQFSGLIEFAVSDDGLHAVSATLVPGSGDCELSNNYGLWMDNGSDGLPILQLREADEVVLGEVSGTFVKFLRIDNTTNWAGGSGGRGKVVNDDGDIIVQTSFDNNTSGVIILSNPPPP